MSHTQITDAALNYPMGMLPDSNARVLKVAEVSRRLERDRAELLEALKAIVFADDNQVLDFQHIERARAVIAKAEGK